MKAVKGGLVIQAKVGEEVHSVHLNTTTVIGQRHHANPIYRIPDATLYKSVVSNSVDIEEVRFAQGSFLLQRSSEGDTKLTLFEVNGPYLRKGTDDNPGEWDFEAVRMPMLFTAFGLVVVYQLYWKNGGIANRNN